MRRFIVVFNFHKEIRRWLRNPSRKLKLCLEKAQENLGLRLMRNVEFQTDLSRGRAQAFAGNRNGERLFRASTPRTANQQRHDCRASKRYGAWFGNHRNRT